MTVDYIQWELLRQREQLRRLLSGGPAENPERESLQENAVPRTRSEEHTSELQSRI